MFLVVILLIIAITVCVLYLVGTMMEMVLKHSETELG